MDDLGEKLAKLLCQINATCPEKQNNLDSIEIHEHSTTATLEEDSINVQYTGDVAKSTSMQFDSPASSSLPFSTQSLIGELTPIRLNYNDSSALAAAATVAAVKFRSNYLPPIGVFWDIENCQVPKGRSAMAVTQVIRNKFFSGYKEAEFIVVCDVQKENKQIIQELNDAQVDLIHVSATCKNAADEKLRQSIRRFGDNHGSPSAIILISGDINFASDLSDMRHRKKIHVILLHKENTSEALIMCSDEHYDFMKLLEPLPSRTPIKIIESHDLLVCNLPEDKDVTGIKRRLKQLSNNCGGRVVQVKANSAIVRFCSKESADRAQKRMHGEYVFDSKINVKYLKEKDSNCGKNRGNSISQEGTASESEANESSKQMYSLSGSVAGARSLPVTPHYHGNSPAYPNWNGMHCSHQGLYQPGYARSYQNNDGNRSFSERGATPSPIPWQNSYNAQPVINRYWEDRKNDRGRARRTHAQQVGSYSSNDGMTYRGPKMHPNHPRSGNFSQQTEWHPPPRPPWSVSANHNGPVHKRRSPSPMFSGQQRDNIHWNGQNSTSSRSDRTPSPYDLSVQNSGPISIPGQQADRTSPYSDVENSEIENFFNPISCHSGPSNGAHIPIELQVTNLDQNIDPKEMKRILSSMFMEHVMVLSVSVFVQSDGNFAASVKVPSLPEAQYAISQLHRRKIGYKRILISYAHSGGPNPQLIRSQIVMLLQEVPGHKLPLFKFREMYESRFMISISVSELYKLKDCCIITDDPSGRMVSLNPDHRNTPSPNLNTTQDGQPLEFPYCTIHALKPWSDKGWAEQEMATLPNIRLSLKVITERVHRLLTTHSGNLPLSSFPNCYEAEFNEMINIDENGAPLEHLISCVPTVELKQGIAGVKHITWATNKNHDDSNEDSKCVSPALANQLALFSRELVDLLKTAPHCQLSFNRFIPAYHHHFGRQCRVADYGFTKLIDLLEALPQTVQVMGEGNKRVVTLSHRAQVRRFTSDLLRVLKAQASKQVLLSEFPSVYARVIGKPWDVVDYGVCEMNDILGEVSENTVVVTNFNNGQDQLIAIPKREQTPDEIERTRQFAIEVIELLKHAPQQRMLFNKFVPSYHHHFGHQCRVSDYGFAKLIELFESIPEVVNIEDVVNGERRISLTEKEGINVLGEQINTLISHTSNGQLEISNIADAFLQEYGYILHPESFHCDSMLKLMEKLEGTVQLISSRNGIAVVSVDKNNIDTFGLECRRVLMDAPNYCLPVNKFKRIYEQIYKKSCPLEKYINNVENYVNVFTSNNESFIELIPIQQFACKVYQVLMQHNGKLYISQFEAAYLKFTGSTCRVAHYGYPTLYALLKALTCTVILKELRQKRKVLILLNRKLAVVGIPVPTKFTSNSPHQDTDSSNDSFENEFYISPYNQNIDKSSRPSSTILEKWDCSINDSNQFSWGVEKDLWEKNSNKWVMSSSEDSQKWLNVEDSSKISNYVQPPKPDSPEDICKQNKHWESSIWSSPNYSYSSELNSANVEVPLPTCSSFSQMNDQASDLLSPTKSLLPAVANPLDPDVSDYFSQNESLVQPPHPSELPLPSMSSFTPKRNTSNDRSPDQVISTPSKRSIIGKCRLAAQFNQSRSD